MILNLSHRILSDHLQAKQRFCRIGPTSTSTLSAGNLSAGRATSDGPGCVNAVTASSTLEDASATATSFYAGRQSHQEQTRDDKQDLHQSITPIEKNAQIKNAINAMTITPDVITQTVNQNLIGGKGIVSRCRS